MPKCFSKRGAKCSMLRGGVDGAARADGDEAVGLRGRLGLARLRLLVPLGGVEVHASHNRERDALCMVGHKFLSVRALAERRPARAPLVDAGGDVQQHAAFLGRDRQRDRQRDREPPSPITAASSMGDEKPVGPVRFVRDTVRAQTSLDALGTRRKTRQLERGLLGRPNSNLAGLLMFL